MEPSTPSPKTPAAKSAAAAQGGVKRVSSEALFEGSRLLEIEHRGDVYRLQCTSQGRLILTK